MRNWILSFAIAFLPLTSLSWWDEGHKVVAEIAYRHLDTNAKQQVDKLIKTLQSHDGSTHDLYFMAVWPDKLGASGIKLFKPWHYIDIPFYDNATFKESLPQRDNVLFAIKGSTFGLASKKAPLYEKARLLSFLIHFVGDIHQPLHATSRITAEHPRGDAGGNGFSVDYETDHGVHIRNLHSLWDSVLGEFDSRQSKGIPTDANNIEAEFTESSLGGLVQELDPAIWAKESHSLAVSNAYALTEGSKPSAAYIQTAKQIAKERLALAGYRLAHLLNTTFAKKHKNLNPNLS
jgi:hypothetical protein